ncbi:MAG: hypothetical protein WCW78_01835 [Candidatus Paceibacterota bacterium]|jgi:hypothetical protein
MNFEKIPEQETEELKKRVEARIKSWAERQFIGGQVEEHEALLSDVEKNPLKYIEEYSTELNQFRNDPPTGPDSSDEDKARIAKEFKELDEEASELGKYIKLME